MFLRVFDEKNFGRRARPSIGPIVGSLEPIGVHFAGVLHFVQDDDEKPKAKATETGKTTATAKTMATVDPLRG
jgi:hypothetical protein